MAGAPGLARRQRQPDSAPWRYLATALLGFWLAVGAAVLVSDLLHGLLVEVGPHHLPRDARIVGRALDHPPPPELGEPPDGVLGLGVVAVARAEDHVARVFPPPADAEVVVAPHDLDLDIAAGRGLDTAVAGALAIGPTSRMLDGESEAVRAAAAAGIRQALAARANGDSIPLGAAIWIVTAINPGG